MPCVNAQGDFAPTLLVFKGSRLPYRQVLNHFNHQVETLSDCLPRGSLVYMRRDGCGVNSESFYECAKYLVNT